MRRSEAPVHGGGGAIDRGKHTRECAGLLLCMCVFSISVFVCVHFRFV